MDVSEVTSQISKCDPETALLIVASGDDSEVFDQIIQSAKDTLKKVGPFEATYYSGEPDDYSNFMENVSNMPLFAPHRLFVFRQSEIGLKNFLKKDQQPVPVPDRTWVLLQYNGDPPAQFYKVLLAKTIKYSSKSIFPEKLEEEIIKIASRLKLRLDEEAMHDIRERIQPRAGAIEAALKRIQELLHPDQKGHVTGNDVREILFPRMGWNAFRLVDSIFSGDIATFQSELKSYNPPEDSFLAILRSMLTRLDQIRKASVGASLGMQFQELSTLLGIQNRHQFYQKKTIQRLTAERQRFHKDKLTAAYDVIVDMSFQFRSNVPASRQSIYFQEKILSVFF